MMEVNSYKRQGQMDSLQSYFYTDSIFEMKHLPADENLKIIIIDFWKYLIKTNKINIYWFCNHQPLRKNVTCGWCGHQPLKKRKFIVYPPLFSIFNIGKRCPFHLSKRSEVFDRCRGVQMPKELFKDSIPFCCISMP